MGSSRNLLGWLALPPVLLAFVLAGLAVSSEPKEEFEERARSQSEQPDQTGNQGELGEPNQGGSGSSSNSDGSSFGDEGTDEAATTGDGGSGRYADGSRKPIIIRTDGGEIIIELDENGTPTRVVSDSAAPGRTFAPDPDGGFVGFRVEDGLLEPVDVDDFQDGDFWLRTEPDTLEIIRPDGMQVRLRVDQDGDLSATRTTPFGQLDDLIVTDDEATIQTRAEFEKGLEDQLEIDPGADPDQEFVVDPASEPIGITLETGPIIIELESDGDLTGSSGATSIEGTFDDASAIRVDDDGNFEIVPLDEVEPDDTVLVPQGDGFDLVRPDGSRVEFRPDGDNDGVTATEVSVDGERTELEPNPDGTVTLDDGRTVGPIDFAEDGGAFERLLDQTSDLPWPWVFGGIALLAALSIGTAVHLHRNRPADQFDFNQFALAGVPENQLEKFLAAIGNEPDPTRAIRLAFYGVERGMAGLPKRRADETPFEWHGRVASIHPQLARPLGPICDLFALARFAPKEATTADRDLMIEHIRELNQVAHQHSGQPATAGV